MLFPLQAGEKLEFSASKRCDFAATSLEHFSHASQSRRLGRDLAIPLNDTNA
jgi:hypothetical protein